MYQVQNLKELSNILDKGKKFLLTVTFFDAEEKQLHTSAFTNNFPTADIPVALKDINKSVNDIENNAVKKEKNPDGFQNEAVKDMLT
jgi:hypothetical protein